jgi:formylmethanofuran dehydrogenase subunit E
MPDITHLLQASAARHHKLCPRQVLGVRIGLAGANLHRLEIPRSDKRLLVIVETDGCFVSGIEAATGCSVGHRTIRVEDYGKVAATFVDIVTGQAFRLAPKSGIRQGAYDYADHELDSYQAQLEAYAVMQETDLLSVQAVHLNANFSDLIGRPGVRVICSTCGEEIMNDRQITTPQGSLCKVCAGESYYHPDPMPAAVWHQN